MVAKNQFLSLSFAVLCLVSSAAGQSNQDPSPINPANGTTSGSLVRDPQTGRWYQQQLLTESVPTIKWESRPMTQTVYQSKPVQASLVTQNRVFVPRTEFVWQLKTRGRLNPFRKTTHSYEYRPVTRWVPATQTVMTPTTTHQWAARHQTVYYAHPVQTVETQQRVVFTEVTPPAGSNSASATATRMANQPRALINLPLLARRNRWPQTATPTHGYVVGQATPSISITSPFQTAYQGGRDAFQSGMPATTLR